MQYFLVVTISCLLDILEVFVCKGLILWESWVPRDITRPSKSEEEPRIDALSLTQRWATWWRCQKATWPEHYKSREVQVSLCRNYVYPGGTQLHILNGHVLFWTTFSVSRTYLLFSPLIHLHLSGISSWSNPINLIDSCQSVSVIEGYIHLIR